MTTDIKCPSCGNIFGIGDAMEEEIRKELREKMVDYVKKKDDEFAKREKELQKLAQDKENEFAKKLQEEKTLLQESLEKNLRKNITADFENQVKMLEQANQDNQEKLKSARQKELEFLQKEQALQTREQEMEISIQRKLQEERAKLSDELRKIEEQKTSARENEYQLRMREMEVQLSDQKRLVEEMKRRAEQGSTQLQGEVQELILEEMLRSHFPFDVVSEVDKGIRGADCILTVRNNIGQECGRIIFESKRRKNWEKGWIEKLKTDMRATAADMAVIVTKTMPDTLTQFGQVDGIWVCSFEEVAALVNVLRDSIIKVYGAISSQENKGDKMHMLYDYLTSNEFGEQWKAIREGFMAMKLSIQKERDAMEKLWKAREKQLEKVLLNSSHIKGSIEGIAGNDKIQLNLMDDDDSLLLD